MNKCDACGALLFPGHLGCNHYPLSPPGTPAPVYPARDLKADSDALRALVEADKKTDAQALMKAWAAARARFP